MNAAAADFDCHSLLPGLAKATFAGRYEGREVSWRMSLYTLNYYCETHPAACSRQARSFMHLQPSPAGELDLTVALNVAEIDRPAIEKAIIMIRNYKHLRLGRHEFGEVLNLV